MAPSIWLDVTLHEGGEIKRELGYEAVSTRNTMSRITFQYVPPPLAYGPADATATHCLLLQ